MSKEADPISVDEFANNFPALISRVIREKRAVVVETDEGQRAILKPLPPAKAKRPKSRRANFEAFRSAAGGWKDVDTDSLLKEIYRNRDLPSRPPAKT